MYNQERCLIRGHRKGSLTSQRVSSEGAETSNRYQSRSEYLENHGEKGLALLEKCLD